MKKKYDSIGCMIKDLDSANGFVQDLESVALANVIVSACSGMRREETELNYWGDSVWKSSPWTLTKTTTTTTTTVSEKDLETFLDLIYDSEKYKNLFSFVKRDVDVRGFFSGTLSSLQRLIADFENESPDFPALVHPTEKIFKNVRDMIRRARGRDPLSSELVSIAPTFNWIFGNSSTTCGALPEFVNCFMVTLLPENKEEVFRQCIKVFERMGGLSLTVPIPGCGVVKFIRRLLEHRNLNKRESSITVNVPLFNPDWKEILEVGADPHLDLFNASLMFSHRLNAKYSKDAKDIVSFDETSCRALYNDPRLLADESFKPEPTNRISKDLFERVIVQMKRYGKPFVVNLDECVDYLESSFSDDQSSPLQSSQSSTPLPSTPLPSTPQSSPLQSAPSQSSHFFPVVNLCTEIILPSRAGLTQMCILNNVNALAAAKTCCDWSEFKRNICWSLSVTHECLDQAWNVIAEEQRNSSGGSLDLFGRPTGIGLSGMCMAFEVLRRRGIINAQYGTDTALPLLEDVFRDFSREADKIRESGKSRVVTAQPPNSNGMTLLNLSPALDSVGQRVIINNARGSRLFNLELFSRNFFSERHKEDLAKFYHQGFSLSQNSIESFRDIFKRLLSGEKTPKICSYYLSETELNCWEKICKECD